MAVAGEFAAGGVIAELRVRWLAALDVEARLPERSVIVRNEAVAHSWRRDIIDLRPELLLGTRFLTPLGAAISVLELNGASFSLGEEVVRAARIVALLEDDLHLEALVQSVLHEGRGWGDALAATLNDIDSATLDVAALRAARDGRCTDLAMFKERLDTLAGTSWTMSRVLREATAQLAIDPSSWPFDGPCVVEVGGHETAALASWLRSIPRGRLVSIATQPRRSAHVARMRSRFGEVDVHELTETSSSELGLLARYLFSSPDVLASPTRGRSMGNDGTVQLEEHAGLEEELDAAVTWVIGEVADGGTSLEQIAIVVPQIDPYASLLRERLEALIADSVHVVGGVPATVTSAGARISTVLRGLAAHLHIDVLADILPILELADDQVHLSRRDAIDALYELGTVGGSTAHPSAALEWVTRNVRRQEALVIAIGEMSKDEDAEYERRAMVRKLEHLRAIGKPLEALDRVARILIANGSLAEIWGELKVVLADHIRTGIDGDRIIAALDAGLAPLVRARIVVGGAALAAIETALDAVRLPVGRFGDARITIASLSDAVGLSFRCVRVVGLAEGMIPSSVREDPVLPDSIRATFGGRMALATDRTVAQLHALHRVVLSATDRLVLSVGRMDPERRYREPSGVLLEAAAAIGRPPLGIDGRSIPDLQVLRTSAFEPARTELRRVRMRWPVHGPSQLDRAVRRRQVPRTWRDAGLFAVDRLIAPSEPHAGIMDGWFPAGAFVQLPGLTSDRPVSASALSRLLECPHRFLYERVLGWEAPPRLADEGNIDALSYGSLFHETAEAFYRAHGGAFCSHEQSLDSWKRAGDEIADAHFAEFLETYPLVGVEVRSAAGRRLRRDLRALLTSDWGNAKTFVDVEREFGPLALQIGTETVHVRGYIDRIDTQDTATLVRDLKTGRAKRRQADKLLPSYDVQLGLYGLVIRAQANAWNVPDVVRGSYVYPADPSGDERSFVEDFGHLILATEGWINTSIDLLNTKRFPRTPIADDCTFCPFKPVCGPRATERAHRLLSGAVDELEGFAALKLGSDESENGDA